MTRNISRILIGRTRRYLAAFLPMMDAWRQKFFPVLIKGMMQAGGLRVTEIARRIRVGPEDIATVWQRVRRHVGSREWSKSWGDMQAQFARRNAKGLLEMSPVPVDFSDLSKPYARDMEFLELVRDADLSSRLGMTIVNPGYTIFESYAALGENGDPLPLVCFPFSVEDPAFLGQNYAMKIGMERLAVALNGMGIAIVDRGFDSDFFFNLMQELKMRFLCRLIGNRTVLDEDRTSLGLAEAVADRMPPTHEVPLRCWIDHAWERRDFRLAWRRITLPDTDQVYTLLVATRADNPDSRIMLISNTPVLSVVDAARLLRLYFLRWRAEDAIRALKSDLGIETVRVADFMSISRLVELAFWVMSLLTLVTVELDDGQREAVNQEIAAIPTPILLFHYRVSKLLRKCLLKHDPGFLSPRRATG
jgi:hypothetical protein